MNQTIAVIRCDTNLHFDYERFGKDVMVKRAEEQITRNQLAQAMGYSHLSGYLIERIELGAKDPRVRMVVNLCAWMNKNIMNYFKQKP